MPAPGTQFKGTVMPIQPQFVNGLPSLFESNTATRNEYAGCTFQAATGNPSNPVSGLADITYNQSGPTVLVPDSTVPAGMRCYVTRMDIDMQGTTPWANSSFNAYCMLSDTANHPLVYIPKSALQWGLAEYDLPQANVDYPMLATVSSFAPATGVLTFGATIFTAAATGAANPPMNGTPFTVVAGTGIGQSGIIASFTGTTVTPVLGANAFPVALDNTSVIAFWYWPVQADTSSTVLSLSMLNTSNTVAANALDNGFNVMGITLQSGGANGSVRPISANQVYSANTSVPTVTVAYAFNTNPAIADVIQITNNSELCGIVDMSICDKWQASQTGKGVQFSLGPIGSWSAGSPLRIYVEGFFAI